MTPPVKSLTRPDDTVFETDSQKIVFIHGVTARSSQHYSCTHYTLSSLYRTRPHCAAWHPGRRLITVHTSRPLERGKQATVAQLVLGSVLSHPDREWTSDGSHMADEQDRAVRHSVESVRVSLAVAEEGEVGRAHRGTCCWYADDLMDRMISGLDVGENCWARPLGLSSPRARLGAARSRARWRCRSGSGRWRGGDTSAGP